MPKKTRRRKPTAHPAPSSSSPRDPLALVLQFALSTEARHAHFLATGEVLDQSVTRTLSTVHLAPQTRARILQIAPDLPALIPLRLPSDRYPGPLWQASSIPSTPADWDMFLNAYQDACTATAPLVQRVQQEVAAEDQHRRQATFDRAIQQVRQRYAQLQIGLTIEEHFAELDGTAEQIIQDPDFATCSGYAEAHQLLAQIEQLRIQRYAEAHAAHVAAEAHAIADCRRWITTHGSEALREALAAEVVLISDYLTPGERIIRRIEAASLAG